jgi:hypothetical protein
MPPKTTTKAAAAPAAAKSTGPPPPVPSMVGGWVEKSTVDGLHYYYHEVLFGLCTLKHFI